MTNHADNVECEDRRICFECVGEAFLSAEVQKNGRDTVCFYCEGVGKTLSIGEVAERFKFALDQHFYRTPTEPSGLEYAMMKEGDYDWERKGEPIVEIIQEYAHIEPEPAEDIRSVLEDRDFDRERVEMGEEGPFDEDAHYAEADVDDAESQAGWARFEESLKTETRYFSRTAEWTLKDIFEGIAEHRDARWPPDSRRSGTWNTDRRDISCEGFSISR